KCPHSTIIFVLLTVPVLPMPKSAAAPVLPPIDLDCGTVGDKRREYVTDCSASQSPIMRQRRNNAPFDPLIALSRHGHGHQCQQRAVGFPVARMSVTLIYVRDLAANQ